MSRSKLDQRQIFQTVFDESSGALKTIPATNTVFQIELDAADGDSVSVRPLALDTTTLMDAVSAAASSNSADVNILNYRHVFISVACSGLTGGALDGTLKVQASLDQTTYHDVSGKSLTLNAVNFTGYLDLTDANHKYFRLAYTHGSISGGTITVKYCLKG